MNKELIKKYTNSGTLVAVICGIGVILNQCGVKVDNQWLNALINAICYVGISLGILNNPNITGMDSIAQLIEEISDRLKNPGTLVAVVCGIGVVLNQCGLKVDMEWLNNLINVICYVGLAMGILNNPITDGIDHPFKVEGLPDLSELNDKEVK